MLKHVAHVCSYFSPQKILVVLLNLFFLNKTHLGSTNVGGLVLNYSVSEVNLCEKSSLTLDFKIKDKNSGLNVELQFIVNL
jgi:hypothetical protein